MLTKVRLVKAMVFPVVMCGCESWTTKKAEGRRTDAFELWCLLREDRDSVITSMRKESEKECMYEYV